MKAPLLAIALMFLLAAGSASANICSRTQAVRDAIVAKVSGVTECANVDADDLSAIRLLDLDGDLGTSGLKSGDFAGLTGMDTLYLSNNQLSELPADIFNGLSSLEVLELYSNRLTELPQNIFNGLSSLEVLQLYSNQLTALPQNVFNGLSSLSALELYDNQLSSLPQNVFRDLGALSSLILSSNQLTSLPEGIFDSFQNPTGMSDLNLSDNRLSSLPQNLFAEITFIGTLNLSRNQLTELPTSFDMLGVEEVFLGNNNLRTLRADTFQGNSGALDIRLNDNDLTELPEGLFQGHDDLFYLDLQNNRLTRLPAGTFEGKEAFQEIYLLQEGDTKLQFNVKLIPAAAGNGAFFQIREGTPANITLTLTVSADDGSVTPFTITPTFAAGNTIQELSGALLRDGGAAAGTMVTLSLTADESVDLEIHMYATMEGFDIVAAEQNISITVPAEGDTVTFPIAVDANKDLRVNASDALILYYAYSLRDSLGTGR